MTSVAVACAVLLAGAAAAVDGPARVNCNQKTFPNLPGQNAVTLARQANGSYTATIEAYAGPKTRKSLKCRFDADPMVFACVTANASWGLFGKKLDERSIDGDGKAKDDHVYKIEAIKTPAGEPRVEQELRFPLDACKAER
jgi:hypothetical protein